VRITETSATDEAVTAYAARRGVQEILHFTTNRGLVGILATGAVLSRDLLDSDKYIEHIYTPNCFSRLKDSEWTGYVNLSISRVNNWMLTKSQEWHETEDVWWAVLAFDTSLLADPGVYFVTTNNTYTSALKRGTGVSALQAMFAESVEWGYRGSRIYRRPDIIDAWTTDPQAEVLYPERVPADLLRAIYVREEEHVDTVRSMLACFQNAPDVVVEHKPEVFQ
jgi:hypothetical protein